jgi:putative ABC transport system permease protein
VRRLLRLVLRDLRRDLATPDLRLMVLAVVIAVGAVSAVGFFSDRVNQAMRLQGAELLAADLVVSGPAAAAPAFADQARELGLRVAHLITFPSVVLGPQRPVLVEVKSASDAYPLRGKLRISETAYGPETAVQAIPAPGSVWVEPRLLTTLGLKVGDTLSLGRTHFRITRALRYEPDRSGNLFALAPQVLLNAADLQATGLLTPASRAHFRLLVAGKPAAVRDFRAWVKPRLQPGERLLGLKDARPEMRQALERAGRFLNLAALLAVLLGGAAVAVTARQFAEREADATAILRTLGATRRTVLALMTLRLTGLGVLASAAGAVLGYVAQLVLADTLSRWFTDSLPAPGAWPWLTALATGLLMLLGFALPSVLRLGRVSPLRVLRNELGGISASSWAVLLAALGTMSALLAWQVADAALVKWAILGMLAALAVLWLAAQVLLRGVEWGLRGLGLRWRFAVSRLARARGLGGVQLTALGVGLAALLLLTLVRNDLLAGWQHSLPAKAPNQFLINIQPRDVDALKAFFKSQSLTAPKIYPMIRGRYISHNGRPVHPDAFGDARARRLAEREFNLSWTAEPAPDNHVIAGQWWSDTQSDPRQFSVEEGLAKTLGIKLGDTLTFEVAGVPVSGRVTSLRQVQWDSFRVNFFVVAPPGLLQDYPATWITSFYLPPQHDELLNKLVSRFPSVTVLDVRALISQVRSIMDQASRAVQFVFLFTLLAGLLVLIAALNATRSERRQEIALQRALGARRRVVLLGALLEFGTLGVLAGVMASAAATVLGYVLARQVFEFDYVADPRLWLVGLTGGVVGALAVGYWGTQRVLRLTPLSVLRSGS